MLTSWQPIMSFQPPSDEQFNRVLTHLQNDNPDTRRKAISWLARSGKTEAIRPLEWTASSDPDEGIREHALKAINHLKKGSAAPSFGGGREDPTISRETVVMPAVRPSGSGSLRDLRRADPRKGTGSLQDPKRRTTTGSLLDATRGSGTGTGSLRQNQQPETDDVYDPYSEDAAANKTGWNPYSVENRPRTGRLRDKPDGDASSRKTLLTQAVRADDDGGKIDIRGTGSYFASKEEELASVIEGYEVYPYQDPNSPDYVSRDNYEQSRSLVQQAYNALVHEDAIAEIIRPLGRALELDKNVWKEEAMKSVVEEVMDTLSYNDALDVLRDRDLREDYIKRRRKQDRFGLKMVVGWGRIAADAAILFAIALIGMFAILALVDNRADFLRSRLAANANYQASVRLNGLSEAAIQFEAVATTFDTHTYGSLLAFSLIWAVAITLLTVLGTLLTHGILSLSTGAGRITETLTNMLNPLYWVLGISCVVGVFALFVFFPRSASGLNGSVTTLRVLAGAMVVLPFGAVVQQQVRWMARLHEVGQGLSAIAVVLGLGVAIGGSLVLATLVPPFAL
ncbi:MAG: HEAT repeat domain-containing protein [Chloroflexota bacterium]